MSECVGLEEDAEQHRQSLTEVAHVISSRGFWKLVGLIVMISGPSATVGLQCWVWISGKTKLLDDTSVDLGVAKRHLLDLENWQNSEALQRPKDIKAIRFELSRVQRHLLEYMAARSKMDVYAVLKDYNENEFLQRWLDLSQECVSPERCYGPSKAAERALAIPRH